MRFPDKPATTALLGIVCGLLVLAILSTPGLVAPKSPNTGQYQQSYTTQASSERHSASSAQAASISMAVTLSETSVAHTSALQGPTAPTTEIVITTTSSSQNSGYETVPSTSTVTTSQSKSTGHQTDSAQFNSFLSLSGVALVLALGSMFFVHRKINKDSSEEN